MLRRCCCWAPGARRCRSISPARTASSIKPAAHCCSGRMMGQTDRRTPNRFLDPAPHTMQEVSIKRLTPALFVTYRCILYVSHIGDVISLHNVQYHQYADHMQLYVSLIFYLELSTCTHSFYRHPIHLQTPPKIPSLPLCLYPLVILCQRLRFVFTIFGATCI